jgi:hypothetical protein
MLLVMPMSLASQALIRRYHHDVMDAAGLAMPERRTKWIAALSSVQAVQAPFALWAYIKELDVLRNSGARNAGGRFRWRRRRLVQPRP